MFLKTYIISKVILGLNLKISLYFTKIFRGHFVYKATNKNRLVFQI